MQATLHQQRQCADECFLIDHGVYGSYLHALDARDVFSRS